MTKQDTVTASGAAVGAALATIAVWAIQAFGGVDVPIGVEGAIGVVLSAACTLVASRVVVPRLR